MPFQYPGKQRPQSVSETATTVTSSSEHAMTDSNVVGGNKEVHFVGAWTDSACRRGGTMSHALFKKSKQKLLRDSEYFARSEK
jgi:hypothetical protein